MSRCKSCGKEIPEDARFCPNCGADQTSPRQKTPTSKPTTAFIISLIAGILILVNGASLGFTWGILRGLPEIIARYAPSHAGEMGPFGLEFVRSLLATLMVIGVVFGLIVTFAAIMLYQNPSNKTLWSVIVLVISILSIIAGGGFVVGFILGIIGGVLGLSWKPK